MLPWFKTLSMSRAKAEKEPRLLEENYLNSLGKKIKGTKEGHLDISFSTKTYKVGVLFRSSLSEGYNKHTCQPFWQSTCPRYNECSTCFKYHRTMPSSRKWICFCLWLVHRHPGCVLYGTTHEPLADFSFSHQGARHHSIPECDWDESGQLPEAAWCLSDGGSGDTLRPKVFAQEERVHWISSGSTPL